MFGVRRFFSSLHVRLLAVNALVLLVPVFGLEFARTFERELLSSLERDMRHQAQLVRRFIEMDNRLGAVFDGQRAVAHRESAVAVERALESAARDTRTRVRIVDVRGQLVADSHHAGPPEGPESEAPGYLPGASLRLGKRPRWPPVEQRVEVMRALRGERSSFTRVRAQTPSVVLFLAEPVFAGAGKVVGVVYVTRSTRPVMGELYRIRSGLQTILLVALALTTLLTGFFALTITRPLQRLAHIAHRIAGGEVGLRVDVSGAAEIRALGDAFSKMMERLERRLHDTRTFAADVAHGFKSPLTSLRGAAELLTQGAADDPAARARFVANIEQDAERLDHLVSRLLELSRLENSSEASEWIELAELLRSLCERAATPDVRVTCSTTVGDATYCGRKAELATAFSNLLDNAVRFSPVGCEVVVGLRIVWDPVGGDGASSWFEVSVRDRGPGVPLAHRARLFERFFTTDGDNGTGLGLAIVKAVAEGHGGSARFEATGEPGACFLVRLPRRG